LVSLRNPEILHLVRLRSHYKIPATPLSMADMPQWAVEFVLPAH